VGLHGDGPAQFTTAEHLDQRGLADEALRVERTGIDIGEAAGLEGVEVQRLVLHAERVGEALELRHPHVQRHLATFEGGGDGATGLLALGATAGGLAALAGDAPTDALGAAVRARGGLQVVDLHQDDTSSTLIRCGTLAIIPRISGRSGRVLVLPMRPRPSARSVPRCLGLEPMAERVWVTFRSATSLHLFHDERAALALPVGLEQALGHELLGVEAAQAGDLIGPLEGLEAGDGGAGHVDVVGRTQRLAQHVVDAGLFEDGAGGATGDHTGTGGGGLEHDPTGTHDPDHGVGDGGAGQRHGEQVLARLLGALLDGEGHLLGLAVPEANPAGAVADHHEGGEREPTAALDHLGHAVDVDDARLAQLDIVVVRGHQNSSPPSRAASASALMRPW
jgi:hypothetical protein